MKKLFSLALVLFAMLFAANAQVTVILEAHDVWGDGSGYQLLLDADHNKPHSLLRCAIVSSAEHGGINNISVLWCFQYPF